MKKEKHHMLKGMIKGMIKEGYGSAEIYDMFLFKGYAYRKERFLLDYRRAKWEIEKEKSTKEWENGISFVKAFIRKILKHYVICDGCGDVLSVWRTCGEEVTLCDKCYKEIIENKSEVKNEKVI